MRVSFLCYEPVPDFTELERRFQLAAELGYRGIELVATYPLGYEIEQVAGLSAKYNVPVVSLLSGWSYANEGFCLSSPNASIRGRAVERLRDYLGWAARLNAVVVVGLMQGLRGDEPDEKIANDRITDCLKRVAVWADELGASIVLEPVNHQQVGFNNTAADAAAMAERAGSPFVGYMLDTIHMNIEERSVIDTIRVFGGSARHFHLCETNGGPFGSGGLDFRAALAALVESGYDRFVSVKVYRKIESWQAAARGSAAFLKKIGAMAP